MKTKEQIKKEIEELERNGVGLEGIKQFLVEEIGNIIRHIYKDGVENIISILQEKKIDLTKTSFFGTEFGFYFDALSRNAERKQVSGMIKNGIESMKTKEIEETLKEVEQRSSEVNYYTQTGNEGNLKNSELEFNGLKEKLRIDLEFFANSVKSNNLHTETEFRKIKELLVHSLISCVKRKNIELAEDIACILKLVNIDLQDVLVAGEALGNKITFTQKLWSLHEKGDDAKKSVVKKVFTVMGFEIKETKNRKEPWLLSKRIDPISKAESTEVRILSETKFFDRDFLTEIEGIAKTLAQEKRVDINDIRYLSTRVYKEYNEDKIEKITEPILSFICRLLASHVGTQAYFERNIESLFKAGADPNVPNSMGQLPYHLLMGVAGKIEPVMAEIRGKEVNAILEIKKMFLKKMTQETLLIPSSSGESAIEFVIKYGSKEELDAVGGFSWKGREDKLYEYVGFRKSRGCSDGSCEIERMLRKAEQGKQLPPQSEEKAKPVVTHAPQSQVSTSEQYSGDHPETTTQRPYLSGFNGIITIHRK